MSSNEGLVGIVLLFWVPIQIRVVVEVVCQLI